MKEELKLFDLPAVREHITRRCSHSCAWCHGCGARAGAGLDVPPPETSPEPGKRLIRLVGGDPFRLTTLEAWVGWARRSELGRVCVEGPGATLGAADHARTLARLLSVRPDAVSISLPSVEPKAAVRWTGTPWDPTVTLDNVARLQAAGIAVEVVFPVNERTTGELEQVVTTLDRRFGSSLRIVLRRARLKQPRGRLPTLGEEPWPELDGLNDALERLPTPLPGGAAVEMDADAGYPLCVLRPSVRTPRLVVLPRPWRRGGQRSLGSACGRCAWQPSCTWIAKTGLPASAQARPLSVDEVTELQVDDKVARLNPHPGVVRFDYREIGLRALLCAAPWTTLSTTDPLHNPVPCAFSWVNTRLTPEELAAESGDPVEVEEERARQARKQWDGTWYGMANESLSLMDIWNSPLLKRMRREMKEGGASSRCRSMCRIVMGVEERGAMHFLRRDAELSETIVENRRLLIEEINEGKSVLTAKPLELMVGVSSHCNITCGFCDGPQGLYGELTDRRRDDIITLLPTLMSLGVSGPGEPLMSPNYRALLAHVADTVYPGLAISLTTNGTLLTPEFLRRHENVGWSHVRVSLNAGSAQTHERMTGKKLFERVMTNIDALCDFRDRKANGMSITLSCVLGSVQMGDLHNFAEIVTARRAKVIVEPMYGDMHGLSPWTRPERLRVLADELESVGNDFERRNPPLSRAFRAVLAFAEERLAKGETAALEHF